MLFFSKKCSINFVNRFSLFISLSQTANKSDINLMDIWDNLFVKELSNINEKISTAYSIFAFSELILYWIFCEKNIEIKILGLYFANSVISQ